MANWYVRPSGGSGSGTSWTAAWNGLNGISWSSVNAGDTIWVAGGSYSNSLTPAKSGTSANRIYVRRARSDASECTATAGWSSAFDATITQPRTSIIINSYNYLTISGRTTSAGGTQGWLIDFTGATSGPGIEWPNGSNGSNLLIEYLDIQGPGNITYSSDGRGVDATSFSSATNNTFSHCKIHDWESTVYIAQDYFTIEYCEFYNVQAINWVDFHPNMVYHADGDNFTFRYNVCHGSIGEGVFWTNNASNFANQKVYGNVFYDVSITTNKCLQPDNTGTQTGMMIFNNTFDNIQAYIFYGDSAFASTQIRNNIISRSGSSDPFPSSGGVTRSNDLVVPSTDVFVGRAAKNFHIVSTVGAGYPRNAGIALTAEYATDPDGVTRGGDGTWDIGAYEYTSGATPPTGTITLSVR